MKRLLKINAALMLSLALALFAAHAALAADDVKLPDVAGAFYPSDANELREMVDYLIGDAVTPPQIKGRLVALVEPHAGYGFSGKVAAHGYRALKGRKVGTVVILSAAHKVSFDGASVYAKGAFRTPLGDVKIDEKAAASLIDEKAGVSFNPDGYKGEHSIEVHIPFLQRALAPGFKIVPVLMGNMSLESYESLTDAVTKLAERPDVLIIASTDLSHYHDYDTALTMDSRVTVALERISEDTLKRALASGQAELCGVYPTLMAMQVARRVGVTRSVVYKYANSGDVTGDKKSVVGYASAGFYIDPLTEADKAELLALARKAIVQAVRYAKPTNDIPKSPRLLADAAVFVTINREGSLRGCIGHAYPTMPLYSSVVENAVNAALGDLRFQPMKPEELDDMQIEISILSPMKPIDPKDIVVGTHGLLLNKGGATGLLLPQVASEQGWDRDELLRQIAIKAGLDADAWKSGAKLYGFTAEVIGHK